MAAEERRASGPEVLADLLARLAAPPRYRQIMARCIQRYGNLPRDEVMEGVQDAFVKVLKHYAGREPPITTIEEAEHVLFAVIRNTLIDRIRRGKAMTFVAFDEQYIALQTSRAAEEGAAGQGGAAADDPDTAGDDLLSAEVDLANEIDTSALFDAVMARFDPKYRDVVTQLLVEASPRELAAAFGQDGYRLRHWARVKFCRALAQIAAGGHDLAAEWHARAGCAGLLQSLGAAGRIADS